MSYRIPNGRELSWRERAWVPELLRGLGITTRHFLRNLFGRRDPNPEVLERTGLNCTNTVQYPEEKPVYPPRWRGQHRLVPREDGKPRCVACYLCATACPAQCIYIEAAEYPADDASAASRVIERYPARFEIDELRCVVCGLCVEACPKDAIRMDTETHAQASESRQQLQLKREQLLAGPPVSHPSDPWNARDDSRAPQEQLNEAQARIEPRH